MNVRAGEDEYNRVRADLVTDRQNNRIDKLYEDLNKQRELLAIHVTDCAGQRREMNAALAQLRDGQRTQIKIVIACALFLTIVALGLKSPLVDAALKAWGML